MNSKLWLAVAIAGLVGAAHMFRYEIVIGSTFVWDRWLHRGCNVTYPPNESGEPSLHCVTERKLKLVPLDDLKR